MLSWVDDILALGHPDNVSQMKTDLSNAFQCKDKGELKDYVGSKIDIERFESGLATVKFTQPVLIQKLEDNFDLSGGQAPKTPVVAGQVLVRGDGSGSLESFEATKYRSGVATCMYMMQWLRPKTYNATQGLSHQMAAPRMAHYKAMITLMRYIVATRNQGLTLAPDTVWNGDSKFKFKIHGQSDLDYAANTDD